MSSGEIVGLPQNCKSAHSDVRRGAGHHGATEGRFTGVAGDCPCFLATGVQRSVARQVLGEADRNVCSTSKLSLAAPEDGPAGSIAPAKRSSHSARPDGTEFGIGHRLGG